MSIELIRIGASQERPTLRVIIVTTRAEEDACYRLREDIYVHELGIISTDHPYVTERGLIDPYDAWSTNLLLLAGDEPIGTIRITQAADGPMELEEQINLADTPLDRSQTCDCTRYMIRKSWRRTLAGPLLLMASWRLLQKSQAQVLLAASKTNNLGRYHSNIGLRPVHGVPLFTYDLTACTYSLSYADFGSRYSLRRLSWTLWAAVIGFIIIHLSAVGKRLLRRGFQQNPSDSLHTRVSVAG